MPSISGYPVPADQHKLAALILRDPSHGPNGVKARLAVSFLRTLRKEVPGHSQLPIACVKKSDHAFILKSVLRGSSSLGVLGVMAVVSPPHALLQGIEPPRRQGRQEFQNR